MAKKFTIMMPDSKELPTHMGRTLTNQKLRWAQSLNTEFLMSIWGMIFILVLQVVAFLGIKAQPFG